MVLRRWRTAYQRWVYCQEPQRSKHNCCKKWQRNTKKLTFDQLQWKIRAFKIIWFQYKPWLQSRQSYWRRIYWQRKWFERNRYVNSCQLLLWVLHWSHLVPGGHLHRLVWSLRITLDDGLRLHQDVWWHSIWQSEYGSSSSCGSHVDICQCCSLATASIRGHLRSSAFSPPTSFLSLFWIALVESDATAVSCICWSGWNYSPGMIVV